MDKPKASKGQREQVQKFQALARELECDEDEEAFKAKLRKVAKAAPPKREPSKD